MLRPLARRCSIATAVLGLLTALLGCSDHGGPTDPAGDGNFALTLTGFDDDVGRLFELRVFTWRLDDNRGELIILEEEVDSVRLEAIPSARFTVFFELDEGETYVVELYADHDGDGRYTAPPADHSWRLAVTGGESDGTLTFGHLEPYSSLEWP